MELIDLIPNSMSFRVVTTLDITDESEVPDGFTGRVRRSARGALAYVAWYHHGRLRNPGRLHPAYRRFRPGGQVKYDLFYSDGLLHDPSDSVPAVRGYFANGSRHYEEHYQHGVRTNGRSGAAAVTKWREDGTLRHTINYADGRRVDQPSDRPVGRQPAPNTVSLSDARVTARPMA